MSSDQIKRIRNLLKDHERRIRLLESKFESQEGEQITPSKDKRGVEKLAKKIDVTSDKIGELFDAENETLTLVKVVGADDCEKTCNTALVILLGYKYLLGVGEVLSQEIRRNVAENRIPLNNFATYLNEIIPSMIRRKGKRKSPKTTYRLTTLGEVEGREVLKKLCG